ncbi:MAG: hypothetical protein N3A69_12915, partial [Leptospiraceae bacterium]|nr:hypothetical protein [Leptospiraceae bacterium]
MKFLLVMLLSLTIAIESRPGSGGSYKSGGSAPARSSSGNSNSFSNYRSSNSNYKSSNSSYSQSYTSTHKPSDTYKKTPKLEFQNYKIHYLIQKNLVVKVKETYQFLPLAGEFTYSFLAEQEIYQSHFYNQFFMRNLSLSARQKDKSISVTGSHEKIYLSSQTYQAILVNLNTSNLNPQETVDMVSNFELLETFVFNHRSDCYEFLLPIYPVTTLKDGQEIFFEVEFEDGVSKIQEIQVVNQSNTKALSVIRKLNNKVLGKIYYNPNEYKFLVVSIPSEFLDFQNVIYSQRDNSQISLFSKIIHELNIQKNGIIAHKLKLEMPSPSINIFTHTKLAYIADLEILNQITPKESKVFLLEEMKSNCKKMFYHTFWKSYDISCQESEIIEIQYNTYGEIFQNESEQLFVYSSPRFTNYFANELEVFINFESEIDGNSNLEFLEFDSSKPFYRKDSKQIYIKKNFLTHYSHFATLIHLPKNTVQMISHFQYTILLLSYYKTFHKT